jgi:hypothetical protein
MATSRGVEQAHLLDDATVMDSDVMDIQCLLNDLNLDALIAGLEPEPDSAPVPAAPVSPPRTPKQEDADRRGAKRLTVEDLGKEVRLTIPGASQTALVNISETGALVETTRRLCPGKTTDVFVRFDGERRPMRVTIIRSTLHSLIPVPIYRTALHFDRILPLTV